MSKKEKVLAPARPGCMLHVTLDEWSCICVCRCLSFGEKGFYIYDEEKARETSVTFQSCMGCWVPNRREAIGKFWGSLTTCEEARRMPSVGPLQKGPTSWPLVYENSWPLIKDSIYISDQTSNVQVFNKEGCKLFGCVCS